jgi:hypothetical protein
MDGNHIWDNVAENEKPSELYCLCCGHFFAIDDTDDGADACIAWNATSILNEPATNKPAASSNKGVIRRRS